MDRGASGVTKNRTRLRDFHFTSFRSMNELSVAIKKTKKLPLGNTGCPTSFPTGAGNKRARQA